MLHINASLDRSYKRLFIRYEHGLYWYNNNLWRYGTNYWVWMFNCVKVKLLTGKSRLRDCISDNYELTWEHVPFCLIKIFCLVQYSVQWGILWHLMTCVMQIQLENDQLTIQTKSHAISFNSIIYMHCITRYI